MDIEMEVAKFREEYSSVELIGWLMGACQNVIENGMDIRKTCQEGKPPETIQIVQFAIAMETMVGLAKVLGTDNDERIAQNLHGFHEFIDKRDKVKQGKWILKQIFHIDEDKE